MAAPFFSSRHGNWHPIGSPESSFQIIPTSRCLHNPALWRNGSWSGDFQTTYRIDGRKNLGRERFRQRLDFSFHHRRQRPAPPTWQTPQPQLVGKRLLVVEENQTNRRIITHRAEQWGMTVQAIAGSNEALRILAQGTAFDAVILDLQLQDMDGLALAYEIRNHPYGRYLPLLLLSSVRLRGDDTRAANAGISVFVYKPIRPAQLLDSLCRALSIQIQREKKAPPAPALDSDFARRLPLRLLLADDNPINQKVGLSVLNKLGYRADIANNGLEVLQALEQKAYDILFFESLQYFESVVRDVRS